MVRPSNLAAKRDELRGVAVISQWNGNAQIESLHSAPGGPRV